MKAWDVIGYTADADIWCSECAREAYGHLNCDTDLDGEGNPIHPIFAIEEWEYPPVCNLCHEPLIG